MISAGYESSVQQCRDSAKKYRKQKEDRYGKQGLFKYFDALDKILDHKPATEPPVVVDTLAKSTRNKDDPHNSDDCSDDDTENEAIATNNPEPEDCLASAVTTPKEDSYSFTPTGSSHSRSSTPVNFKFEKKEMGKDGD